jgi:glycosyltransferase involved in cell wall biosynthesis
LILLGRDFGEKKRILKFLHDNEINKNVIFIDNITEPKDFFFASDINILTSSQEGFSNSIIESMSAGLPNIVSNVGGNSEAVINNYNGFVIEYNNIYHLQKSIQELLTNSNLRNKFSNNSLERFNEYFTEEICIKKYNKVYNI